MFVCIFVRMYVYMYEFLSVCMYVCMYVCMNFCLFVCTYVWMLCMYISMNFLSFVIVFVCMHFMYVSAQEWRNHTLAVHERVDSATFLYCQVVNRQLLILLGTNSLVYNRLALNCNMKSVWNLVPLALIITRLAFVKHLFTFHYTCVRPQCDFSILARKT